MTGKVPVTGSSGTGVTVPPRGEGKAAFLLAWPCGAGGNRKQETAAYPALVSPGRGASLSGIFLQYVAFQQRIVRYHTAGRLGHRLSDISAVKNWDMSYAVDITKMFKQCTSLKDISPVAGWELTTDNLLEMFYGCTALQDASALSSMDVSDVVTFTRIFGGCSGLASYPDWSGTWGSDGTLTVNEDDARIDLNDCDLTSMENQLSLCVGSINEYNNKKTPAIKYNGEKLTEGEDFVTTYVDNDDIGKAYVILKGIGDYKGTVYTSWRLAIF